MNTEKSNIEIYQKLNTIKPKHLIKKNNTLLERLQLVKTLEKLENTRELRPQINKGDYAKIPKKGGNIIIYH